MMHTFLKSALLSSCAAVVLMAASTFQASAIYPDDDDNDDVASRATQKPNAFVQEPAVNTSTSASHSTASQTSAMDDLLQGLASILTGGYITQNYFDDDAQDRVVTGGNQTEKLSGSMLQESLIYGPSQDLLFGDLPSNRLPYNRSHWTEENKKAYEDSYKD